MSATTAAPQDDPHEGADPALWQRLRAAWHAARAGARPPAAERPALDPADLGTAYGMECSLAPEEPPASARPR